jgi:alpha-beta hydrolase superfamily lysophospholipase
MEPQNATYTAADGTDLPMRVWRPETPQAALVYLHGIQSHLAWYGASSRRLALAGIAVYQVERRGSGRDTAHERGHVERAQVWLEDVARVSERACEETGIGAVHLMGVSWGGKLALACAGHRPDIYRSLILASPGIIPVVDVALMTKARVAKALALGRPLERFPIPLEGPHLFTENRERVAYIEGDDLSLRFLTARFMRESRRLDRLAQRAAKVVCVPVFLALAERDRIIDNQATEALVQGMPAEMKRVVTYPGAHHTLEFEPDPEPYFADLVAWIEAVESAVGEGNDG